MGALDFISQNIANSKLYSIMQVVTLNINSVFFLFRIFSTTVNSKFELLNGKSVSTIRGWH